MADKRVLRSGKTVSKSVYKRHNDATEKTAPLEKSIVAGILKYLNGLPGCRAVKVHGGMYSAGEPDIDCCYRGRAIKIEVKRPGGRLTKLQEATLEKWKAAGAIVGVVHSVEEVKKLLEGADNDVGFY